ncbi:hypothetical protein ABIG06_002760 [Bradyrhizobium sp. USDA 326]
MDDDDRGRFSSAHMGTPDRRFKPRSLDFLPPETPPDPPLTQPPT